MKRLLLMSLVMVGCGDDEPPAKPLPPKPAAPAPVAAAGTPVEALKAPTSVVTADSLIAEARKRQLTAEDFKEADSNRDPFRNYLSVFAVQQNVVGPKQHKIVMQKFGLDEIKLVAIVAGDGVAPKAMFVDPSGLGITIVRGDHVSKLDASVVRISPDKVFFQYEEDAGGGKTKMIDRVIELHAGEVVTQ
jgi:hypothetical protein